MKKVRSCKTLFKQLSPTKDESDYRTNSINKIPEDAINLVRQFYQHDGISTMAHAKEDVVTVRSSNGKEKVQKRHLHLSIKWSLIFF